MDYASESYVHTRRATSHGRYADGRRVGELPPSYQYAVTSGEIEFRPNMVIDLGSISGQSRVNLRSISLLG